MTSLSKVSSCTDKDWDISLDNGLWLLVQGTATIPSASIQAQIPVPVDSSQERFPSTDCSCGLGFTVHRHFLPYPLGGLFLFQAVLCKEHWLPPGEHVAIGTLLEASHVTTA